MSVMQYGVYECKNSECGLRFPALVGSLPFERCPRCKAAMRKVTETSIRREVERHTDIGICGSHWETLIDNVRSGWNVGAMFRTADGLGVRRMHLCGITPTPEHSQIAKTALGSEKVLPWVYASNAVRHCRVLMDEGYSIWALEETPQAEPVFDLHSTETIHSPAVLVVGNEVAGVDPDILALCDRVVAIPMCGSKRSLNVAVAYAIAISALIQIS